MARPATTRYTYDRKSIIDPAVKPARSSSNLAAQSTSRYQVTKPVVDSFVIQRPFRDITNTQHDTRKQRETVSAAGVFKRKSDASARDRKHRRRREKTPEPDALSMLRDAAEECRAAIGTNAATNFDQVEAAFNTRLEESRADDEKFLREATTTARILSAPLTAEKIETQINKDGKRSTVTVEMGERVSKFEELIQKEEAKLKECWKQWDKLQTEYLELGIEVFGAEVFGEAAASCEAKEGGFKREMELLDSEHNTRVEELDEEIEDLVVHMKTKMETAEKKCDKVDKKEQEKYLKSLLHF